jgi:hypothetical protein
MASQHDIDVIVETINPKTAQKYLDQMPKNRRLSQTAVDRWAKAMRFEEWIPEANGPIRFDTDGNLIDGQHRLRALIATGLSLPFVVVRNVPPAGLYVMDLNRTRTLADALYINGEIDSGGLASTINFYAEYLRSGIVQKISWTGIHFTIPEALAVLDGAPGLRGSLKTGHSMRRYFHGGPGRWAIVHYILSSIDPDDSAAFFAQLSTGADLHQAHPILQLRKRLIEDAGAIRKLPIRDYTALIFKAWNMWRAGKTTPRALYWRAGGRSPEPYPIPE